ncbi:hypothetical protein FNH48_23170 [Salmonella enterica subsp. salamae]|nr:hypothetical protein [Salmonella enterica subsp. salamae]
MRNKMILAIVAVGMMYGASAFAAGAIATTDDGGGVMTFSGSVIDVSRSIVPDSQNIKVDQGLSIKQILQFGSSYYQSDRVFI